MAETAQDASAPLSRNDKMKDEDVDEGVFFFPDARGPQKHAAERALLPASASLAPRPHWKPHAAAIDGGRGGSGRGPGSPTRRPP